MIDKAAIYPEIFSHIAPIPDCGSLVLAIFAIGLAGLFVMHYVMIAAAVIAAASAIYGGVSASNANTRNKKAAEDAAFYTAKNAYETGIRNSRAIIASITAKNAMTAAITEFNVDQNWDVALYNSDIKMLVGDYNAKVKEQEAFDIWEAANLDIQQLDMQGKRTKGDVLAAYGASGAQINDTDSVKDALVNTETAIEMDKMVVRYGADMRAKYVRNEAARSRWDGYMAASQIIYEASQRNMGMIVGNSFNMLGNAIQGSMDATMTYDNAIRGASSAFAGGQIAGAEYGARANSAMVSGLFSAAGSLASAYISSQSPTTTKMDSPVSYNDSGWMNEIGNTSSQSGSYSANLTSNSSLYFESTRPLLTN